MMDYVEDDPMLVEFVRMDQERQNPPPENAISMETEVHSMLV